MTNANASILTQASRQWASRPADERYTSLTDMHDHFLTLRRQSAGKVVSTRAIEFRATDNTSKAGIEVYGANGVGYAPTHFAFGQACARVGAPASYLRTLPAPLACDALNYGFKFSRTAEDVGVLIQRSPVVDVATFKTPTEYGAGQVIAESRASGAMGGDDVAALLRAPLSAAKATAPAPVGSVNTMRAMTGPKYGRVWNHEITGRLVDRFGDGVSGDWRVPGEFGKAVTVTKANTTLYASDRDMFVFLADETNRIEMPNRRGGRMGSLARGFFVWNSEVGDKTIGVAMFLFDYTCSNRIVWGVNGFKEIKLRHTVSAPDRWLEEVSPVLNAYHDMSADPIEDALKAAQAKRIDDLDAFLANRVTAPVAARMMAAHEREEGRPIETVWDAVTGLTAHARSVEFQDDRVELERIAGRMLDAAL